ncbi:MAG: prepilin-type N-terminal cleavage/methylation domain-containing protein [Pseudomonadota bacterium]
MNRQRGFTLMEMIAVMAILAVLSAIIAPSIVDTVNDAYAKAEDANLDQIADDLELYIRRNGVIPSGNIGDWSNALATLSSAPSTELAANRRGYQRMLYFDPSFFGGGSFGGYVQSGGLTAPPASPRVMIISDLRGNVAGQGNNAGRFDDIWNQNPGARIVESDTVKIRRINLGHLFKEVLISTNSLNAPGVSLNGAPAIAVPAAVGTVDGLLLLYVLEDTRLSLLGDPFPVGSLQSVYKVKEDLGLRYEDAGGTPIWVLP